MPTPIKSPAVSRRVVKKDDEKVIDIFRELGFGAVRKPPSVMPVMPDNSTLHTQSVMHLSELNARYTSWREYAEDQLIVATAKVNMLTEEVDSLRKRAFIMAPGSVTEKNKRAEADEGVMVKHKELTLAKMMAEVLAGKVESFTNCINTISREISLRSANLH